MSVNSSTRLPDSPLPILAAARLLILCVAAAAASSSRRETVRGRMGSVCIRSAGFPAEECGGHVPRPSSSSRSGLHEESAEERAQQRRLDTIAEALQDAAFACRHGVISRREFDRAWRAAYAHAGGAGKATISR